MCGIAGYVGRGSHDALTHMIDAVHHRGPDDAGLFIKQHIGLGHKRLSILDVSASGQQPMSNEDGTVHLVFNGEIYNYQSLKEQLKQEHVFTSNTDTEIIIHLYEEVGERVFDMLHGMFAIALYDEKSDTLLLARDRMGQKPLYWGVFDGTLLFGSELKSIFSHPKSKKTLSHTAIHHYLTYEYVPTPLTMFEGVFKLEPGQYMRYVDGTVEKYTYWDIPFEKQDMSFDEAVSTLDTLLKHSVAARLMSDVPLGVFLSGGVDSSTIAYYAQTQSSTPIKTFSIAFAEDEFDESAYAKEVSDHLGTEHHEIYVHASDVLPTLQELGALLDEPLADPSLIPTYILSKQTKQSVTVALSGDGADELFLGYDTFLADRASNWYARIAPLCNGFFQAMARLLPTSFTNISFDFKVKKFFDGFGGKSHHRHTRWLAACLPKQKQQL